MSRKPTYEELEQRIKELEEEAARQKPASETATIASGLEDLPNNLSFADLFDIQKIQAIQDAFAKASNVASIITEPNGQPITQPSNFCRLCRDIIRKTTKGLTNCMYSDSIIGQPNPDGPTIQPCLSGGLWDAGVSIRVGERHIANWLIGQVRDEFQDEERMLAYAHEIGADEEEFRSALAEVPTMPHEQFINVGNALYLFANQISQIAYQNVQQENYIAALKQVEEALRQSEEKFRSIFEIAGAGIAILLPEGNYLEVNPAFCKILGYTEAEFLNLKVDDITHPDDRKRTRRSYDEIMTGQRKSFNYEKRYLHKDGSTVWGHVDVVCVLGTPSRSIYCVGLMQDITARKMVEVALQSSRKMLQAVLDTIPVRVFWKDRDLRYLGCNINFAEYAGLNLPEAIIGKDDYQLSWHEQAEMYRADDRQIIESGIPKLNDEEPQVRPDGTTRWLKTSKIPLQDNLGNIFGVLGCYEDITERKKMEQALQTAHDELEKRVEKRTAQLKVTHDQLLHSEKLSAIGKLSASIAHEFNNPLFGIRNVLGGIKKRAPLDEEDAELVDMALQECDRIKYLIQDLRDFNRPTGGIKAPVDIHKAIDSILLLLKNEFKNKKIKVEKDYTTKMPNICAVGDQIKQVLLNMLNNASDAISASEGTITIITHLLNKMIAVHIQDTGTGIKPEDMDHIFEPFFTTKPEIEGTGLGLSVSYGIIKRHGGRIDVHSEVGKGSIFTITLPIEEASK